MPMAPVMSVAIWCAIMLPMSWAWAFGAAPCVTCVPQARRVGVESPYVRGSYLLQIDCGLQEEDF